MATYRLEVLVHTSRPPHVDDLASIQSQFHQGLRAAGLRVIERYDWAYTVAAGIVAMQADVITDLSETELNSTALSVGNISTTGIYRTAIDTAAWRLQEA